MPNRWIPIVHSDTRTVGVARLDGDTPLDVTWVGEIGHPVTPDRWQSLLSMLVPEHRGSGEGWMVRTAQEGVKGLEGTLFEEPRVEAARTEPAGPEQAHLDALRTSDPEAARLIERTMQLERDLRARMLELQVRYTDVQRLAAAIERNLSPYDRATLATAFDAPDLPHWCRAVADRWWAEEPALRG